MADESLQQSWQFTRARLEAARQQLPAGLPIHLRHGPLFRYEEWLFHNELELAFNELEDIGAEIDCQRSYWSELLAAAENMGLPQHAERCKQRLAGG